MTFHRDNTYDLPAYVQEAPDAEEQGRQAFAAGTRRIVPRSILVDRGVEAARAWYWGWDAANLAAPVEGVQWP